MSRIIDSWRGELVGAVTHRWGPATHQAHRGDQTFYEWVTSSSIHVPSTSATQASPIQTFTLYCTRQLVADRQGRVTGGAWRGNNCCATAAHGQCALWQNPARP